VRDSKNRDGGTQFCTPSEWAAFVVGVKAREFDDRLRCGYPGSEAKRGQSEFNRPGSGGIRIRSSFLETAASRH
jgi:hypothetical protein